MRCSRLTGRPWRWSGRGCCRNRSHRRWRRSSGSSSSRRPRSPPWSRDRPALIRVLGQGDRASPGGPPPSSRGTDSAESALPQELGAPPSQAPEQSVSRRAYPELPGGRRHSSARQAGRHLAAPGREPNLHPYAGGRGRRRRAAPRRNRHDGVDRHETHGEAAGLGDMEGPTVKRLLDTGELGARISQGRLTARRGPGKPPSDTPPHVEVA